MLTPPISQTNKKSSMEMAHLSIHAITLVVVSLCGPRFILGAAFHYGAASIWDGDIDPVASDIKTDEVPVFASVLNGGTDAFGTSKRFQVDTGGGGGEYSSVRAGAEYKESFRVSDSLDPFIGTVAVTANYALDGPDARANINLYNNRGQADSDSALAERTSKNGMFTVEITGDIRFFELVINTAVALNFSDPLRATGHIAITSITIDGTPVITGELPGDYNRDGIVDASDYVTWRDNLGSTNILPNDATPGNVGQDDYEHWRSGFGQPTPGAGSAPENASVPEPASVLIVAIGLLAAPTFSRRQPLLEARRVYMENMPRDYCEITSRNVRWGATKCKR
jgi:hypothetical protein